VSNPLPIACVLLVAALPLVYLLGRRLTDWLEPEPEARQLLAPAAAVSAWLLAVATLGRLAASFVVGLVGGTIGVAALGAIWTWRRRTAARGAPEPLRRPRRPSALIWGTGVLATLPVAFLTLRGDFFDDFNLIGHRSMVAQFQNDTFPPRHQVYPEYPFRYHYGFNVVAAASTALFRLSVAEGIDVVVIAGFMASWCLAWRLGERLTESGRGGFAALGALFGGGAFFWFLWHDDWVRHGAVGVVVGGNRVNFPVVMYFFQKPFALGIPLALAALLALSFPAPPEVRGRRGVLLAVLLAPLSLAEVVLFVMLLPAAAVQELISSRHTRALVPMLAALLLAVPLGGVLFTPMPHGGVPLLRPFWWLARQPPAEVACWYFLTTGLLLPLALLGLAVMPRLRVLFALTIGGCFAVPLVVESPGTWDVVKFSTVGQLAAGLAAGAGLAWIASRPGWRHRTLLAALVVLLTVTPIGVLGYWTREVLWPTPELGALLQGQRQSYANRDWSRLIDRMRRRNPRDGSIYTGNPLLLRQIFEAGLFAAGPPVINEQFGVPPERAARRKALLDTLPEDADLWRDEGVSWFITGPGEPFAPVVDLWVATGVARPWSTAGPWRLARLTPRPATRRGACLGKGTEGRRRGARIARREERRVLVVRERRVTMRAGMPRRRLALAGEPALPRE
jgi:hypothetical protein